VYESREACQFVTLSPSATRRAAPRATCARDRLP